MNFWTGLWGEWWVEYESAVNSWRDWRPTACQTASAEAKPACQRKLLFPSPALMRLLQPVLVPSRREMQKESKGRPLGWLGSWSTLHELKLREKKKKSWGLFSYEEPKVFVCFLTTYRVVTDNTDVGTFQRCTVKEWKTTLLVQRGQTFFTLEDAKHCSKAWRGCGNSVCGGISELNRPWMSEITQALIRTERCDLQTTPLT